jgi:uncharacterized protein YkwD
MRVGGETLAAAALLAVFSSVSGGLAAQTDAPKAPVSRWHDGGRLGEEDGRLKRLQVHTVDRRSRAAANGLRWRAPFHVDSVEERTNRWRASEPRTEETPPRAQQEAEPAPSAPAGYENVLLREINQVRTQHGLPAFRSSPALREAADSHSRTMAARGFFAHESADGSAFWKRVERFYPSRGFRYWSVGENLAYGSPNISAEGAVRAWMDSPGHRANLLSQAWQEVGLSAVHDDSAPGVYDGRPVTIVTADFGVRR